LSSLGFERRKRADMNLNIAPLIDIIFLLLIFFVLSSHFVSHKGFKIKLPIAAHAPTQKDVEVTICISKEGEILINDRKVPLENLMGAIKSGLSKAKSKTVVIKADKDINLGLAIKVMDIAKKADADSLVISTKTTNNENDK